MSSYGGQQKQEMGTSGFYQDAMMYPASALAYSNVSSKHTTPDATVRSTAIEFACVCPRACIIGAHHGGLPLPVWDFRW